MTIYHYGSIAPVAHLEELARGTFHLTLAHLYQNPYYRDYYRCAADLGEFVVIDNSSIELGEPASIIDLVDLATDIHANEIVVPDCIIDPERSTEITVRALEELLISMAWRVRRLRLQLQIVPHGGSLTEWFGSLQLIVRRFRELTRGATWIPQLVIGLPKEFPIWTGSEFTLASCMEAVRFRCPGVQYHLLGQPRNWLELLKVWPNYLEIRSTDTVKPIVYAMHGIDLMYQPGAEYPGRPTDYFDRSMTLAELDLARKNLRVFKNYARREIYDEICDSRGPAQI